MLRKKRFERPVKMDCYFCQTGQRPDYKDKNMLMRFVSDRGKIVSRNRGGLCAKHQRQTARAVKRARFLALIPFVTKI